MKKFLIAIATATTLVACSSGPEPTTLAEYNQIKAGMTQSQVESILGSGSELSRSEIPGTPVTVMYSWQNPSGSNMSVMFQDDKVITTAQYGLK